MSLDKMNSTERHAALTLASIMSLRMLGLFMVLPLFSLYAHQLIGATPLLIGISMGIYGLTQAIFQIPFGAWSDRVGRKKIITLGLCIFALGSVVSASATHIWLMILGRALQGAGAVGSTIIALLADLTRENQRTKAMALIGMTIGMSFSLAMLIGPLLNPWLHVNGIFWLAAGFSLVGIFVLYAAVPPGAHIGAPLQSHTIDDTPMQSHVGARLCARPAPREIYSFSSVLKNPDLMRLNTGIFLLHAVFTASFVVIPISLQTLANLSANQQWLLYLPTLILAFAASIPCIIIAEKKQRMKLFFFSAIVGLSVAEILLWTRAESLLISAIGLFLFFASFSVLEAFLPSLVSKTAPAARKGMALGIYSCSQFLGIFVGGAIGGWLYGALGLTNVYLFCTLLTILWATIAFRMKNPQHRSSTTPSLTANK
jgi:MFS family permease